MSSIIGLRPSQKEDGDVGKIILHDTYVTEEPNEILKLLVKNNPIFYYKNLSPKEMTYVTHKGEGYYFGISIKNAEAPKGTRINRSIEDIDFAFLHESDSKFMLKNRIEAFKQNPYERIKSLISSENLVYSVKKKEPKRGGIKAPPWEKRRGTKNLRASLPSWVYYNYFLDRNVSQNADKEIKIDQIMEYAKIISEEPHFSINDLEKLAKEEEQRVKDSSIKIKKDYPVFPFK